MAHLCTICNKTYSTKSSLTRHMRTACKKGKKCRGCNVIFYSMADYESHLDDCITDLSASFKVLEAKYDCLLEYNDDFRDVSNDRVKDMKDLAMEGMHKHTTQSNNIYNGLIPITKEWMDTSAAQITQQDVDGGIEGIANFIANVMLKDRAVATDIARRMIAYIDENKEKVRDAKGIKLLQPICASLEAPVEKHYQTIKDKLFDMIKEAPAATKELVDHTLDLTHSNIGVKSLARKEAHPMSHKLIGHVCTRIPKK